MARKTELKTPHLKRKPAETTKNIIKLHEKYPEMTLDDIGKHETVQRERSTVCRALKRYNIEKKRHKQWQDNKADIISGIAEKSINKINEGLENLEVKTSQDIKNLGVTFGILTEKELLTRGQATQIHTFADLTASINKEIQEKLKEQIKAEMDKNTIVIEKNALQNQPDSE